MTSNRNSRSLRARWPSLFNFFTWRGELIENRCGVEVTGAGSTLSRIAA